VFDNLRLLFGEAGIWLDQIEATLTDFVARTAPWITPFPVAFLSATSTSKHFEWPLEVGFVVGVIVETVGLAAINTTLDFWSHNRAIRERKTYAAKWTAPTVVPLLASLAYFIVTTVLVVVLEIAPDWSQFAKILLVFLSAVGMITIAMRRSQRNRIDQMIVYSKNGAYPYSGPRYAARRKALLAAGFVMEESQPVEEPALKKPIPVEPVKKSRGRKPKKDNYQSQVSLLDIGISEKEAVNGDF